MSSAFICSLAVARFAHSLALRFCCMKASASLEITFGLANQCAPSTASTLPLTKEAVSWEERKTAASAMSSTVPETCQEHSRHKQ